MWRSGSMHQMSVTAQPFVHASCNVGTAMNTMTTRSPGSSLTRPPHPVTILGAGRVGGALLQSLPDADFTHRRDAHGPRAHEFRLEDQSTWPVPPLTGRTVVWTFPAEPLNQVVRFHDECLRAANDIVVLGSTSAYLSPPDGDSPPVVDEASPLDTSVDRVRGEEWLRERGATILQLGGIFSDSRGPADWIRDGLIPDRNKLVNLVHVDDIVAVIIRLFHDPRPGQRINVTNGERVTWGALVERLVAEGKLDPATRLRDTQARGKYVDTRVLARLMRGHGFRRP